MQSTIKSMEEKEQNFNEMSKLKEKLLEIEAYRQAGLSDMPARDFSKEIRARYQKNVNM